MRMLIRRKVVIAVGSVLALTVALGVLAQLGSQAPRSDRVPAPFEVPARPAGQESPAQFPKGVPQLAPAAPGFAPDAPSVRPMPPTTAAQPAQPAAAPAARAAVSGAQAGAGSGADAAAGAAPWDRMIIRSASLALQVEDVEAALERVRGVARSGNGWVASSNTYLEKRGEQERMAANVVMQVRAEAFDAAVQTLRQIALKVESEQGTSQDVTEEYVDLDSDLRNLQSAEAAIIRLMDRAQRIEDVLALQRELRGLRAQIERIQGRKRFLERRSEMATISVSLRLPPVEQPKPQGRDKGWNPLLATQRGWEASLAILRHVADGVLVALGFSWWLVPFAALGAYLWQSRRARPGARPAVPTEP